METKDAIYRQIEERAVEMSRLRDQLERAESDFQRLVRLANQQPQRGQQTIDIRLAEPVHRPAEKAKKKGTRLGEDTKNLLRYMKRNQNQDRAAMAKILGNGKDDEESRGILNSRLYSLRKSGIVRELANGSYDVLVEVP